MEGRFYKHKVEEGSYRLVALPTIALCRHCHQLCTVTLGVGNHLLNGIAPRNIGKFKGLEGLEVMVFPVRPAGIVGGGAFRPHQAGGNDGFQG